VSMSYTVDRNAEGAYRVTALVTEGVETWFHTSVFYGYGKREALTRYREHVKTQGWKVSR